MTVPPLRILRRRLAGLGRAARRRSPLLARVPALPTLIEGAARLGYGARGFVYLSAGLLTLLAATDRIGAAVGTSGAAGWLAGQPFGRVWLTLLGLGLWAFVGWRLIQAVFDADHEGRGWKGLATRAGQAASAAFYGLLASTVFEYLDEAGARLDADDAAENQEKAQALLAVPGGHWLLLLVGLAVLGLGIGNIVRAWTDHFTDALACPERFCRAAGVTARLGYAARGLAYLPLAAFVILAGWRARAHEVTDLGGALDALERQPGGDWVLGLTAVGLMLFGAFAVVEARWRRIRPPRL